MYAFVRSRVGELAYICTHTYIRAYTNTYIHTYTKTHTHTHTQVRRVHTRVHTQYLLIRSQTFIGIVFRMKGNKKQCFITRVPCLSAQIYHGFIFALSTYNNVFPCVVSSFLYTIALSNSIVFRNTRNFSFADRNKTKMHTDWYFEYVLFVDIFI